MKLRLARFGYGLLWWLLLVPIVVRMLLKGIRQPGYRQRLSERLGYWPAMPEGALWIHAVSVGETIAAKPLIERWLTEHPSIPIIVTTMTPTGSETVRKLYGERVQHAYLPWDIIHIQRKLVKRLKPKLLVIMETELWPNLIRACSEAKVPTLVANARLSKKSARGYQRLATLTQPMLQSISGIAAQYNADGERFTALGVTGQQLQITGSIKFDIDVSSALQRQVTVMRRKVGSRPIWIAASTHPGEDEQVLALHSQLLAQMPDVLLLLVPRHPERADRIAGLLQRQHFQFSRRTQQTSPAMGDSVFLVDTLGEMMLFFGLADVAFIGNTLNNGGGHNPIEPAALAKPVIVGPSFFNFQTIIDAMRAEHAVVIADTPAEQFQRIKGLLQSKDLRDTYGQRAYLFYQQQQGALTRLFGWVEELAEIHTIASAHPLLQNSKSVREDFD